LSELKVSFSGLLHCWNPWLHRPRSLYAKWV